MELIGKIVGVILFIFQIAVGFITFFGILWFIHPYLSIGAAVVIAFLWFNKKGSIRY